MQIYDEDKGIGCFAGKEFADKVERQTLEVSNVVQIEVLDSEQENRKKDKCSGDENLKMELWGELKVLNNI